MGRRVAVVGAGPCGMAFADVLSRRGLNVRVLEAHDKVGGTWCVDRARSQLYDGLRTNLPKELMAFPGEPFPPGRSFVTSQEMEAYLDRFADRRGLRELVSFGCRVLRVEPQKDLWKVRWTRAAQVPSPPPPPPPLRPPQGVAAELADEVEEDFDAVVVANGHFNKPRIPPLLASQQASWQGRCLHSIDYARPEVFKGQVVVVVGAKSSGTDIARELDGVAAQVHVCDPNCPSEPWTGDQALEQVGTRCFKAPGSKNVLWRPRLCALRPGSRVVEFEEGQPLEADVVIFCTGYYFEFEFLPPGLVQLPGGKRVAPICREMMHAEHPTLFLVGLNQPIVPFPFFEAQAQWVASMLLNPALVPPREERAAEVARINDRLASGVLPASEVHVLPDQFAYLLQLLREARLPEPEFARRAARLEEMRDMYLALGSMRSKVPGADDAYRRLDFSHGLPPRPDPAL